MDSNDQTLLNQWYQHGDAEAFHQITRRYAGLVYGTCRRILQNPSDAEDVAQECFETLAVKTRADGRALGAWLHTVATHRALDRIKTESRRREREHRAYAALLEPAPPDWDEIYTIVDGAIAALPEKERVPLVAHFLEGRTHVEIAEWMGVSRPTIGYRIQQGLERIRKDLKRRNITTTNASLGAALATGLAAEAAPATLIAGLGKIAVSSLPTKGNALSPFIITTITGSILMKKAAIIGAIVIAIAGGAAIFFRNQGPGPPPVRPVSVLHDDKSDSKTETTSTFAVDAIAMDTAAPAAPPGVPSVPVTPAPAPNVWPDKKNAGLGDLAIAGRVVDARERPIGGVFIQLFGKQGPLADVHTREDGSFRMTGLPPGNYRVHVFPIIGYSDQDLNLEAGDDKVKIVMQANAKVAGRVVDARTGSPVPRFKISSQDGIAGKIEPGLVRERLEVEDPRGLFELRSVELGEATLIVEADDYATEFTPLRLESSEPVRDIKIAVQPGVAVEGHVTDSAGNPVVGAWVFAETPPPVADLKRAAQEPEARIEEVLSGVIAGTSGKNGAFAVRTLRGDETTLYAFHPNHGSGQASLAWSGTSPLRGVNLILENSVGSAKISVTVDGKPAEGVEVFASLVGGHGTVFQRGATGADGRATLADLPAGLLGISAIYAGHQQHARRITAEANIETDTTAHVSIEFTPATASLEGVVRLGEQPAIGGIMTFQLTSPDRADSYQEDIKADGTFRFEGVAAGNATLQVSALFGESPRIQSMPITLAEGERQQLEIDMAGGGSVQGVVVGVPTAAYGLVIALSGEQVTEDEVTMALLPSIGQFSAGTCVIGGGGAYFIDGLPAGEYTLLVLVTKTSGGPDFFNDAKFVTETVDVVDGETTTADINMSE